ncbi:MAG: peptidyl-prolyl cis-trans isomerase [Anaerotignum sp.]|nr:peptidyl-prolyl cis-trans isomerase [Anaerotignum sp.]
MKKKMKSLLGILLAGMLCLTACGSGASEFTDEAVLKIDGQEIMKSEYMVYLYTTTKSFISAAGEDVWNMDFDGHTADELVEERTISTIQSVIAAKEYAAANGIALTEEEKAAAKAAAEQFIAGVSQEDLAKMGVDVETLQPMMEDSYLYTLVHQSIAEECDVDAADMDAYYQANKDQMKKDYTSLKLQTILLDDGDQAEEVAKRAKDGEDFVALFDGYDVDPSAENGGEMTVFQNYLQTSFGLTDELETGDVAGPLKIGEGYFILKAVEKTVPTEAEVKELAESSYRTEQQTSYTEARFTELTKDQTVEKIESAWKTLEKFH